MVKPEDVQLFRDLAELVIEVSQEQKLIKIKSHGDYWALITGNVIGGLKLESCLKNLSRFVVKEETKFKLEQLKVSFTENSLISYRFMSNKDSDRVSEYHEAYLLKFLELLDKDNLSKMTAREMQAKGGSAKTEAKSTASRENGKKGGRPKKKESIENG